MFRIRPEQIDILAADLRERLVDNLLEEVRQTYPEKGAQLLLAAARSRVAATVERAEGYGLTSRQDLTVFVLLDFGLGAGFENSPDRAWARALLRDADLSGGQKIARLREGLARAG